MEVLSECIASINNSLYKLFEIIVVDNKSTDGSQEWVKQNHPNIILLENDKNYGYAGGCNRGVSIAKGEYVVFLNNDTIQDSNWLEPLINLFENVNDIKLNYKVGDRRKGDVIIAYTDTSKIKEELFPFGPVDLFTFEFKKLIDE